MSEKSENQFISQVQETNKFNASREVYPKTYIETKPSDQERHILSKESPFQDLLFDLRENDIQASTSEWLDLQRILETDTINTITEFYLVARSLLVKDRTKYAAFNESFLKIMSDYISPEVDEIEQKCPEGIDEVVDGGDKTSEDVHGGNEATKDIPDSVNPADNGKSSNKGAEKGQNQDKSEKKDTDSSSNRPKNGKNHSNPDSTDTNPDKINNLKSGQHRLIKSQETHSLNEYLHDNEVNKLDRHNKLTKEQMGSALASLTSLIADTSENKSNKLDAKKTILRTAKNGGIPELVWEGSTETKPKVMMLFDVGGSTDEFRPLIEDLFTAASDCFNELNIYYFHNAPYGEVWPQSDGNWPEHRIPIDRILDKDPTTKVIIVGDAWMSHYELHSNNFSSITGKKGMDTLMRIKETYESNVWINPIFQKDHESSDGSGTIKDIKAEFDMYDLSLDGLNKAVIKLMN